MGQLSKRSGVVALFKAVLVGGGVAVSAGTLTASLHPKPSTGYPSPTVGAVVALVDNPNPFPVKLTSATFGAVTATPLAGRTCAAANVVAPAPVTWPPRSPCRPTRSTRRSPPRGRSR